LSFIEAWLRFLKSMHKLFSPFFFLTCTKLATHYEYLKRIIILSPNNFFISFPIIGKSWIYFPKLLFEWFHSF
jgi:hypothetical protein